MSAGNRRGALVRKGTGAAYALSTAQRIAGLQRVAARARRKLGNEYGHTDPAIELLTARLEERLEAAQISAEALMAHVLLHAPAPRDDSDDWLCLNPSCRTPLYGYRTGAKCCSSACRNEVRRLREKGLLPPAD